MHTIEEDPSTPTRPQTRRMTTYHTREARPRWILHMQAVIWRFLMKLGMFFHKLALPRPPKPDFYRDIPATISGKAGTIRLHFYVPRDYGTQRRLWIDRPEEGGYMDGADGLVQGESRESEMSDDSLGKIGSAGSRQSRRVSIASTVGRSIRRLSSSARRKWGGYPVVINFHGGGFTLGSAGDDARWCGTVVDECWAVVCSVEYRLAPEHPFPTAVEDGVDAVLYIHDHAEELGIDKDKIALSGFSSGGNMAFTVPLRLYDEITSFSRDDAPSPPPASSHNTAVEEASTSGSSTTKAAPDDQSYKMDYLPPNASSSTPPRSSTAPTFSPSKTNTTETITEETSINTPKIRMLVPWYPPVDYTRTRSERRATGCRPDQELPALFTDLFDESYLHPPHTIALDSPYLSPGVAPTSLLKAALPEDIIMHTCEWDMLLDEGRVFSERLRDEIGKKVWYKMIEGVPHGWDKAPNPWKPTPGVREHYLRACKEMRRVFYGAPNAAARVSGAATPARASMAGPRPPIERLSTVGQFPTAAPRGSISVVR